MDYDNQNISANQPALKASGSYKYLQPYKTKGQIILDNFLGGISWSLGTIVGFTLIAILAGFFISRINLIPVIGNWLTDIIRHTSQNLNPASIP